MKRNLQSGWKAPGSLIWHLPDETISVKPVLQEASAIAYNYVKEKESLPADIYNLVKLGVDKAADKAAADKDEELLVSFAEEAAVIA